MSSQAVRELFSEGLRFLYDAHQQGSAQATANQRTSTSPKLRSMLKAGARAKLGQVAAHFYLAAYGTLRNYAEALGNREAVRLLQRTLDETGLIDREFSRLAGRLTSQSGAPSYGREVVPATTAAMHPAVTFATVLGLVAAGVALTGLLWPAKPACLRPPLR